MKRKLFKLGLFTAALLIALLTGRFQAHAGDNTTFSLPKTHILFRFAPSLHKTGTLAPGALGLPGEQITWTITVSNNGTAAGTDLTISDTVRDELRIDQVETERGTFTVNGQNVILSIPRIDPGETLNLRIITTILSSPSDGLLMNQALMTGTGPSGSVTDTAVAEVSVPSSLPATGYSPSVTLPGDGEPPVWVFALGSALVVACGAAFVWMRGGSHHLARR